MNGGSCVDGVASFTCHCEAGFTGKNCETGEKYEQRTVVNFF